jgi:putative tryptophan/tyrosine transport system substrate-binding protein
MKRREFIALLAGATTAFPLPAFPQRHRMRRIGILMSGAELDLDWQRLESAIEMELKKLGWVRGRDIRIDYRWPGDDVGRINAYAIDLVELGPELIVVATAPAVQAVRRRSDSIPVIFLNVADPIGSGLVPNLPRPGAKMTGFTASDYSICRKWLEIVKEVAPRTARVALVFNPDTAPNAKEFLKPLETAAPALAIKPAAMPFRTTQEIERAIEGFARPANGALLIMPEPNTILERQSIIDLASKYKLPAVYPFRFFAASGGLASYGADMPAQCTEVAIYIDRILRGQSAGDLPVQAPTKFELVINLKTARALNFTLPPALLARANEVIE